MIRNGLAIPLEGSWSGRVIIMDEPTAAVGVKEFHACWSRFLDVKSKGLPIVPISHNMPHVFEVPDRSISIAWAGARGD